MDPKQPGTTMTRAGERVDLTTGEVVNAPPAAFDFAAYLTTVASPEALAQQKLLLAAYDTAVASLVGPNDVQEDGGRTFKKKSAWRKLARFFGISVRVISKRSDDVPNEETGRLELVTEVVTRATAPWGQTMEAVGVCSTFEKRFKGPGAYMKRHADCFATAQTRATNRCVSDLIAAGEVSAEEMEGALGSDAGDAPTGGAPNAASRARGPVPVCPKCGGAMWDNRGRKRNEREPDFRCKDKKCLDEKGYVTSIFHYKPEGEVVPNGDANPTATTAQTPTDGPTSATPNATKADDDRKVNGRRLGDFPLGELWELIQRCGDEPKYAELKAVATRVYDRRAVLGDDMPGDDGTPNDGGDGDDLPF